jgi:uncharacterized protein
MITRRHIGTVGTLWRYPVKSMLGERQEEMLLTPDGTVGDRAWALRDPRTGRIASAKKYPALLNFRAKYDVEPTASEPGRVLIEMPNGRIVPADAPEASDEISDILGLPLRLENKARSLERTSIVRETVFGDVPVEKFKPEWTPETMPDYFELKTGSFFEIGSVYILSSGSVEHLRTCQGGTALIDQRRFRPNIYVESSHDKSGFVEDSWIGGKLTIGDGLVVDEFAETIWCVTSTLAQEDLPRDLSVLRTLAQHHKGCLGVYATVRSKGRIRVGDPVVLSS